MSMIAVLPMIALNIAAAAPDQPVHSKSPLAVLVPTKEALPACARFSKIKPDDPPSLKSNPQISSDPAFLEVMARPLAREGAPGKVEGLREGMMAVFWEEQEREEVLFMVSAFDQPAQAAQAHEILKANFGKNRDFVVFAKGRVVALIRDMGFSPSCFTELRRVLDDLWNRSPGSGN